MAACKTPLSSSYYLMGRHEDRAVEGEVWAQGLTPEDFLLLGQPSTAKTSKWEQETPEYATKDGNKGVKNILLKWGQH